MSLLASSSERTPPKTETSVACSSSSLQLEHEGGMLCTLSLTFCQLSPKDLFLVKGWNKKNVILKKWLARKEFIACPPACYLQDPGLLLLEIPGWPWGPKTQVWNLKPQGSFERGNELNLGFFGNHHFRAPGEFSWVFSSQLSAVERT